MLKDVVMGAVIQLFSSAETRAAPQKQARASYCEEWLFTEGQDDFLGEQNSN